MSDPLRPDEVIPPDRKGGLQARRLARDAAWLVPNLLKLLGRLLRDPRVPRRSKIVVGAALTYVASPIDLVPEFLPVGLADDLLVVVFAVNHLINVAGEEVVLEHWDGPRDLLDMVRSVLEIATDFVPFRFRRLLSRLSGS